MPKLYVLKLTAGERVELERLVRRGKTAAWKLQRAQALLKCDQGVDGPGWTDAEIAEAFGCTTRSLESWRMQAVEQGPLSLLERKPRAPVVPKLDGEKEAQLVRLACSKAPAGRNRWTLRLLAGRLVELNIVESISHETVRRAMKKTT
jgi:homeodomain-containing protein